MSYYLAQRKAAPRRTVAAALVAALPVLVQHVASASNLLGLGLSGDNFKIPTPNAVLSGNILVLTLNYPHAQTPTITDNNGNTWPASPSVSADNGVGNYVLGTFVLPNARAGQTTLTVSFGSSINPFQYTLSEFNNIALASPVNGTSSAAGAHGAALNTGSFTPGNNDAAGGNLILSYFGPGAATSAHPTDWVPGSGFALLDADIYDGDNNGFPHASQWRVQTTSGAINPGITATGDSTNAYNCVSLALKCAVAGTAPAATGIRIVKLIHQTTRSNPANMKLKTPWVGTTRVICTPDISGYDNVPTDSNGNTWTQRSPATPYVWIAENTSPDNAAVTTINPSGGGTGTASFRIIDIVGAAAASFDTAISNPERDFANGTTSTSNWPSITPSTSNGLVIALAALNLGPGLSVTSPASAIWDLCTYTGEIDGDLMENADLMAHYYNPNTSQVNFNWTFTGTSNNFSLCSAVALKAA